MSKTPAHSRCSTNNRGCCCNNTFSSLFLCRSPAAHVQGLISHRLIHSAMPGVLVKQTPTKERPPLQCLAGLPVGARKVEAPHQRRKSWWQLGSRWDSLAWLPGNPTPSLTNTDRVSSTGRGCVFTRPFSLLA